MCQRVASDCHSSQGHTQDVWMSGVLGRVDLFDGRHGVCMERTVGSVVDVAVEEAIPARGSSINTGGSPT